jgi:hypothetical protein
MFRNIASVYRIDERRLRPVKTVELADLLLGDVKPRVSLARASHALEQAALANVDAGERELACRLLLAAIRHDQLFKLGERELAEVPSCVQHSTSFEW